jgi:ABC-type transporter Mla maintaining outer membrane lipid asymmetry ATPase subunit MlaF
MTRGEFDRQGRKHGSYPRTYRSPQSYGEENILAGVSLAVRRGAAVAITGESGEGKTALLSIMGLLQSAEGRVVVDGQDVSGFDQQSKAMVRGRYFAIFSSGRG